MTTNGRVALLAPLPYSVEETEMELHVRLDEARKFVAAVKPALQRLHSLVAIEGTVEAERLASFCNAKVFEYGRRVGA